MHHQVAPQVDADMPGRRKHQIAGLQFAAGHGLAAFDDAAGLVRDRDPDGGVGGQSQPGAVETVRAGGGVPVRFAALRERIFDHSPGCALRYRRQLAVGDAAPGPARRRLRLPLGCRVFLYRLRCGAWRVAAGPSKYLLPRDGQLGHPRVEADRFGRRNDRLRMCLRRVRTGQQCRGGGEDENDGHIGSCAAPGRADVSRDDSRVRPRALTRSPGVRARLAVTCCAVTHLAAAALPRRPGRKGHFGRV